MRKQRILITSQLIGSVLLGCVALPTVKAQIAGDGTLSTSATTKDGIHFTIEQGNQVGGNLFHSFREFSVPTGGSAVFNNAPDVQNIFSRVTGGGISNIDGLIKINGAANLFLLNPNGIIFGPSAKLNIGGSFIATTASSIRFADGTSFSATTSPATPLLTISVPIGLQFGSMPGSIQVQGQGQINNITPTTIPTMRVDERTNPIPPEFIAYQIIDSITSLVTTIQTRPAGGLEVGSERTLALIGGNITIAGTQLVAPQGRVELGSVAGNSLVGLIPKLNSWDIGYEGVGSFQDISLSGFALVTTGKEGGGGIHLRGRQVTLREGSSIFSSTAGDLSNGEISIKAEQLTLESGSLVGAIALAQSTGRSAYVTINTSTLTIRNGVAFSISLGSGDAGNITIEAPDTVELIGALPDGRLPGGMNAATGGTGTGGTLNINTGRLIVREGAQVSATTGGRGDAGNVIVTAESMQLSGESANSQFSSGLFALSYGTGKAGNVIVETDRLAIADGASIATSTRRGLGGNVVVRATESIELSGTTADGRFESSLATLAIGISGENTENLQGGDVQVETRRLIVREGAQISASGFGTGQGGRVDVRAESVELSGESANYKSGLFAVANLFPFGGPDRSRQAGSLNVVAAGELTIRDGALVSVSGQGLGSAGNITIAASSIRLDNRGAIAATTASGDRGNITLNSRNILLRRNSNITTNATGTAIGGNISINTGVLAALENSDITANALFAQGGQVIIRAQGILGSQVRRQPNLATSDITASSELGPQFDGVVNLQTPDINATGGLVELPENFVDVAGLIEQRCVVGNPNRGELAIAPSSGKLPSPREPLTSDAGWIDTRVSRYTNSSSTNESSKTELVEATGWIMNSNGQIELVASPPTVRHYNFWYLPSTCNQ